MCATERYCQSGENAVALQASVGRVEGLSNLLNTSQLLLYIVINGEVPWATERYVLSEEKAVHLQKPVGRVEGLANLVNVSQSLL